MRVSLLWLEINAQPTYVLIDRVLMAPVFLWAYQVSVDCQWPPNLEILDVHGITEYSHVIRPTPSKPFSKPH
jgi:hypothetical protein